MQQAKFTLEPQQVEFLSQHRLYGYKDKSAMVRAALARLQHLLEQESLRQSAALYAEVLEEDEEVQELTASARVGWPE
jgi:Arc/MetJ-type ribon-helix-helix transcriptional regulator